MVSRAQLLSDLSIMNTKHYFSDILGKDIAFNSISELSDEDLNEFYYELLETYTSVVVRIETYDAQDPSKYSIRSYIGAQGKRIIVKQFIKQVRREQEWRFQYSNNLNAEDICAFMTNRTIYMQRKENDKFSKVFCNLLKEVYGEDSIFELEQKARKKCNLELIRGVT